VRLGRRLFAIWNLVIFSGLGLILGLPHFSNASEVKIIPDASYTIRSIRVEGGWLPNYQPPFDLPVPFSYCRISEALEKARFELHEYINKFNEFLRGEYMGIIYASYRVDYDQKNMDVVIQLYHFGMGQIAVGDSKEYYPVLPIPGYVNQMPDWMLKHAPRVGLTTDRAYGTAPRLGFSIDGSPWLKNEDSSTSTNFTIKFDGAKSITKDFYTSRASAAFRKQMNSERLKAFSIGAVVESEVAPKLENKLDKVNLKVGGSLVFQQNLGWVNQSIVGGSYSYSDNDFDETLARINENVNVHDLGLYLASEGRVYDAIFRMGLWSQNGFPDQGDSFSKLAMMVGFNHEISLSEKKSNQTIGIELLAGAGYAFSDLPQYAGYYGGNRSMDFLYERLEDESLTSMPLGPLFRGVGEQQLGVKTDSGSIEPGSSYWHINLNIAIPLPFAYFPLIPNYRVEQNKTLKDLVKSQVKTAESNIALDLLDMHPEWSDEKAEMEAAKIFRSVRPSVNYLVDKANAYALKPIFMVDVASVGLKDFKDQDVRLGLGGGLQLSIVNVRFEVGYMRTVIGLDEDEDDNIFGRIYFRTLF
jgi:hypothetical protein